MEPSALREELERRGLVLLAVCWFRAKTDVLLVFLHGNEGQWYGGRARRVIRRVPGVLAVTDSVQTPTILLVRVKPDGPVGSGS